MTAAAGFGALGAAGLLALLRCPACAACGSISIDPLNPNHAYVSYLSYNTITSNVVGGVPQEAALPGHVFSVTYDPIAGTATWVSLDGTGTGAIGDMAAHLIDHPYWALGLRYPISVEATSTPWGTDSQNKPVSYPLSSQIVYKFPARGSQPPVTVTWNDSGSARRAVMRSTSMAEHPPSAASHTLL